MCDALEQGGGGGGVMIWDRGGGDALGTGNYVGLEAVRTCNESGCKVY